jgi:hypothetical protein
LITFVATYGVQWFAHADISARLAACRVNPFCFAAVHSLQEGERRHIGKHFAGRAWENEL